MDTLPKYKTREWLVRPLDGHTNEVISRRLAQKLDIDEVETEYGGMFRCDFEVISRIVESKKQFNLRLEVYRKKTNHAKLEFWPFTDIQRLRKSAKYQAAKKAVENKKD
jgi:hypothetical protein